MEVVRETSIVPIKNKMTDIRRRRNGKAVVHNYYNNCDADAEIFAVYGENAVVLWENDRGVLRGYFYTTDLEELAEMASQFPEGCTVDFITRTKGELCDFFPVCGFGFLAEMLRYKGAMTAKEYQAIAEKRKIMKETLWCPENVRCAELSDADAVYAKLYEVFDSRESHLPTREELAEMIAKRWCVVYHEDGALQGIYIVTISGGEVYGYQIWNGARPEGYFSIITKMEELIADWFRLHPVEQKKMKPGFCWVNKANKKAKRLVEFWGSKFDGMYDYVWVKV